MVKHQSIQEFIPATIEPRATKNASTLVDLPVVSDVKRAAFTLVELLVVIGIIAVLISILLPALGKAREQANRVACGSNLHQIYLAAMMYQHDNHGWLPPPTIRSDASPIYGNSWALLSLVQKNYAFIPGNPSTGWWLLLDGTNFRYLPKAVTRCPSADTHDWNTQALVPDTYMIDYDYRFNDWDPNAYTTDDRSKYARGILGRLPSAALFHEAAGYRLGPNTWPTEPYTGPNLVQWDMRFKWPHRDGGNVARFDGAVVWLPNHIDKINSNSYSNAHSWPTGANITFYNYYGSGLDVILQQN